MEKRRLILAVTALAGAHLGMGQTAAAATGLAMMPSTFMLVGMRLPAGCAAPVQPAFGGAAPNGYAGPSKMQALLGGRVSQLELIRQGQDSASSAALAASPALMATSPVAPAPCQQFGQQLVLPSATGFNQNLGPAIKPLAPDDFLASKRLPVSKTAFDAQWNRVRHAALPRGMAAGLLRSISGGGSRANLAAVNSWTNAHVRFVDDRVQYGRADYWAGARATLRRGSGDCEDIAIAKMQLLSAIGVARSDMYLTIARDLARNADHALLVVKLEGRYWLLDNATDELLDASQSYDYRPILTYSDSGKWLHGY